MEPSISKPISAQRSWKHLAPGDPSSKLRRTPRVLSILYDLFDNEYLHSGHVKALDPLEKSGRLLHHMAQHRVITRIDGDWDWQPPSLRGGSPPLLYELAERGAYDLARFGLISTEQWREWSRERKKRNERRAADRDDKPTFLPHQIANADVLVWLAQGCAACGFSLERGYQLMRGRSPRSLIIPGRTRPLVTDHTLRIEAARRCVLFIETDRGTEPYVRHDKNDLKSIERMVKGYLAYAASGMLPHEFDVEGDAWYQLTVTSGDEKRVEGIARTAQAAGATGNHFLVTNFETVGLFDPFSAPWMNSAGTLMSLAP